MTRRFRNILVAIDSRWEKHPAQQWAVRLAEHNRANSKIVDVLPDLPWIAKVAMPDSIRARVSKGIEIGYGSSARKTSPPDSRGRSGYAAG